MAAQVRGTQASGLYPSVDLGRRYGAVPEQLLNRPQVGSALQEMGRKRVPEGVWMDRSLTGGVARPHAEAAADVGRGEPPAGLGEEQRRVAGLAPEGESEQGARARDAVTGAITEMNRAVAVDHRYASSIVPIRDGVMVALRVE